MKDRKPVNRRHAVAALARVAVVGAFGTIALATPASAQDTWPSRPIRLIVPFPPGGSSDGAARLLAPRLAERLGQSVVVENRAGAGGTLGVSQAIKSPPDGYTIVLAAAGGLTITPTLNPKIGYDPFADLAPITGFARTPFVLIGHSDLPATDAKGVIEHARRNPGRLSYATGGNGTAMHIGGEMLKSLSGSFIVHIPYRGSAPAALAAMGGEVSLAVVDLPSVRGHRDNPRLKILAQLGRERSSLAPDLPTLHEAGLQGFDVSGWFGLFAPPGTPPAVLQRLNAEITAFLREPEVVERFKAMGIEPMPTSSARLTQVLREETAAFKSVIERAGIKLE